MSNYSPGTGFMWFLSILFVVLKLTGKIAWSWWWVFSPIWVTVLIIFLMIGFSLWMIKE